MNDQSNCDDSQKTSRKDQSHFRRGHRISSEMFVRGEVNAQFRLRFNCRSLKWGGRVIDLSNYIVENGMAPAAPLPSIGIVAVAREGFYLPQRTSSDIFKETKAADLFGTDQIFAECHLRKKMGQA